MVRNGGSRWLPVCSQSVSAHGRVYDRWTDEGILQGTMVLTSAEGTGTITLRFHLALLPMVGPPPAIPTTGSFVVVSGTGAYENIHGVGTAESMVYVAEDPVAIDATFSGTVHVDP